MSEKGFPKSERIVSQKLIDKLFTSGQSSSLTAFPLRAVFCLMPTENLNANLHLHENAKAQLLLSVPKRRFKHAVDRNRVKRQLREAYRCNKQQLISQVPQGQMLLMAFVWMSAEHLPSPQIEQRVASLLQRVGKWLNAL